MEDTKTMADLARAYLAANEKWYATRRIGGVAYDPEFDCISIDIEGGLSTYDIHFDRITKPDQFTEWMLHLNEKSWMTGQIYKDLLDCLEWVIREKSGQEAIQFYKVGLSS